MSGESNTRLKRTLVVGACPQFFTLTFKYINSKASVFSNNMYNIIHIIIITRYTQEEKNKEMREAVDGFSGDGRHKYCGNGASLVNRVTTIR